MQNLGDTNFFEDVQPSLAKQLTKSIMDKLKKKVDKYIFYKTQRWLFFVFLINIFIFRVLYCQEYYVIAYILGLYLLKMSLYFFTPKRVPLVDQDAFFDQFPDTNVNHLYQEKDQTERPLVRQLPEFDFWLQSSIFTFLGIICTFFDFFRLEVYWPILLFYFIGLVILFYRKMQKHKEYYQYEFFETEKLNLS